MFDLLDELFKIRITFLLNNHRACPAQPRGECRRIFLKSNNYFLYFNTKGREFKAGFLLKMKSIQIILNSSLSVCQFMRLRNTEPILTHLI